MTHLQNAYGTGTACSHPTQGPNPVQPVFPQPRGSSALFSLKPRRNCGRDRHVPPAHPASHQLPRPALWRLALLCRIRCLFHSLAGHFTPSCYNGPMRALVKTAAQPGLTYAERRDPMPGPNDAVIRVKRRRSAELMLTSTIGTPGPTVGSILHASSVAKMWRSGRSWNRCQSGESRRLCRSQSHPDLWRLLSMPYRPSPCIKTIASSALIWMDRLPTTSSCRRPSSGRHRRTFLRNGLPAGTVGQCGRCGTRGGSHRPRS